MLTKEKVAKRLAKNLRKLRALKGVSQEDLSVQAGLGRAYYWRVEQGSINVTLETLVKLGNALHVDVIDLLSKDKK